MAINGFLLNRPERPFHSLQGIWLLLSALGGLRLYRLAQEAKRLQSRHSPLIALYTHRSTWKWSARLWVGNPVAWPVIS